MTTVARRLTPQPIKLRADIELTCFKPAGIDAIKRALNAGEAASTSTVPIKAKLVAPPFYVLDTNATDKACYHAVLDSSSNTVHSTLAWRHWRPPLGPSTNLSRRKGVNSTSR